MKVKKFIPIIAFILCLTVLNSTVAIASEHMVELSHKEISAQSVSADSASNQAKKINEKYKVMFLFIFTRSEPSLFNGINGALLIGQEVKVKGNSGLYSLVETEDKKEVYVFSGALGTGVYSQKTLTIPPYAHTYVGNQSSTKVTAKYDGADSIQWSVSDSSVISFDEKTGIVKGLKPGVATITAKAGLFHSAECVVSVINKWHETESANSKNQIQIKAAPGASYDTKGTISKGTGITARGDMTDGSGWIYVSALNNSIWGFIKVSDFPGIDYLMTEYHYYDEGYEERFSSASTKIYNYASVLNDVMIANFKLKVCPYVYPYTSAADQCKIWTYGSDYLDNLSGSCPKNDNHKADSCLQTGYLRDELKNRFGNGGGIVSKVAWTGHIMTDHDNDRSVSTVGMGTIIITPYSTVHKTSSGYVNDTDYEIRRDSVSTLMHETIHQLGVFDHYCYDDQGGPDGKRCSNTGGCYVCYGNGIKPDCMMMVNKYPTEDSVLLCSKCKSKVSKYLSDNF